ncbi:ABC transporter substrate-binding protein [Rhizobium sp. Root274]|uniref:ABC transporter substrate-binding protein n=1 Tax=unclassified Rhizobium TaxID=2613769 RepID=UPI0007157C34|nr:MULTISPECIES: ABC transporter substrate-binding protein [unclassified Rhizobium]KQW29533.1 ABC transporter substrate-binding protein [Rhizobium sp. Root1240]KRD29725.1 ABC transporter substrate-binding protein [Rhizobium sp. Root274]
MTAVRFLTFLLLLGVGLLSDLHPARALEGERVVFHALAPEQARLVVRGATDVDAMKPLILDFQQLAPEVTVEFNDYVTNDLFREAEAACRNKAAYGDLLLSSSVDQLVKLANDGCAQDHRSQETEGVASWANWRDEVFGFTFEPAVIVYDGKRVPPEDVPRSHVEIAELLRAKPDLYRNRIGTYDVRVSGIGYLLAFHDSLQAPTTYGRLLESFSRADVVTRCCNSEVLGEIANGRLRIAYNVLGSYAYAASRRNPDLRVVIPRDYALILSRGALIPEQAPNPGLAKRFLDYLLSPRGQKVAREKAFFFSEGAPLPPDVDGPMSLIESGIGRPIRIGPALLAAQDQATRDRFIANWSSLFSPTPP